MNNYVPKEIEELFLEHYREWCLISYSYIEDMEEAEDVVQDVMEKVLSKLENDAPILNLKSYIFIAIKNTSLKRLKKSKKLTKIIENDILVGSCEEDLIGIEQKASLMNALNALPDQSRRVFELCVLEGVKYDVAANTLNISTNTVKYHVKKGYKILKSILHNHYIFSFSPLFFTFFS